MLKKDVLSKILIILLIALVIMLKCSTTFATINTNITISNRLMNDMSPIGNKIIGALQVIGIFILVGTTIVVGMKFMTCSVEEKADYKKTAISYIIGAALIFATTQIINIIYNIFSTINT